MGSDRINHFLYEKMEQEDPEFEPAFFAFYRHIDDHIGALLKQLPESGVHARDIQLMIPKQVIASRLAIQPETFSRILTRLRNDDLIEVEGPHVVLRDVEGLRTLVGP